jgi:hypothetical protein
VRELAVEITNVDSRAIQPHFYDSRGAGSSRWWTIASGPRTLAAGATAEYRLRAPKGYIAFPKGKRFFWSLTAVSTDPMTISNVDLPLHG